MADLQQLYFRLPYPFKVVAASLRGWRLRQWRYGPETDGIVRSALEMESWAKDDIEVWQENRLRSLLERAAISVPHYRRFWESSEVRASALTPGNLHDWPVLAKEAVRANPADFLVEEHENGKPVEFTTSGSTGTPIRLAASKTGLRNWYALAEARWRRWYGVSMDDRWAILGGQLVARPGRKRPPFWVWNSAMRQLYLSAYHLMPDNAASYIDAMRKYRVTYMLGYPSAMVELAVGVLEKRIQPPPLKVIISNAEPLLANQREILRTVFGAPVRDTYGMAEMVVGASECDAGRLHLWPEAGYVEVLDDSDSTVPSGEVGRLVCTTLVNGTMPLVRYETGDRGALAQEAENCPCGRTLPILAEIEGRLDDVVIAHDGRKIGRLDTVFKADLPVKGAQIIQEEDGGLRVKMVWSSGPDERVAAEITARIRDRVGPLSVTVESVERIPRGPSGKVRGVISHFAPGKQK